MPRQLVTALRLLSCAGHLHHLSSAPLPCRHPHPWHFLAGVAQWERDDVQAYRVAFFSSSVAVMHKPPWPNGQGVGPLIRRLRARVPQGVLCLRHSELSGSLEVLGQAALDWQVGGQSTPLSPRAPEPVRAAVGLQIKGFFAGASEAPRHVSCRCQTTLF